MYFNVQFLLYLIDQYQINKNSIIANRRVQNGPYLIYFTVANIKLHSLLSVDPDYNCYLLSLFLLFYIAGRGPNKYISISVGQVVSWRRQGPDYSKTFSHLHEGDSYQAQLEHIQLSSLGKNSVSLPTPRGKAHLFPLAKENFLFHSMRHLLPRLHTEACGKKC